VRELTKSVLSFSWAMSMYGARQMAEMVSPQGCQRAAASFDQLARFTGEQLGAVAGPLFRSGDELQRGLVDAFFGTFESRGGVGEAMRRGGEALQRSAAAVGDAARAAAAPSARDDRIDWGPVRRDHP
jgi:hypothetical protein